MNPLRHTWMAALLGGLLPFAQAHAALPERAPLRVMSFNIRYPNNGDGPNQWGLRRGCVARLIEREAPDIIGLQEAYRIQADALVSDRPEYAWFGRGRRGGTGDEHMAVLYRRDRLRLLEHGDAWLSDTPDIAGSISWGHPLPRMLTWGLFERLADHRRFMLYNTHFPYRDQDDKARENAAALIHRRVQAIAAAVPVIVTGDFNTGPESRAHAALLAGGLLEDTRTNATSVVGPDGTWQDFTGIAQRRIDWIVQRGFVVQESRTVSDACPGGHFPSDHFPVLVTLLPR